MLVTGGEASSIRGRVRGSSQPGGRAARRARAGGCGALGSEFGLSERQARRYVRAAERCPDGVVVPERTEVFTVRLPGSLIAAVRAAAAAPGGGNLSATTEHALRVGRGRWDGRGESSGRGGAPR